MALFHFIIFITIAIVHPVLGHEADYQQCSCSSSTIDESPNNLIGKFDFLQKLENGVPDTNSTDEKLSWLRSQVIGRDLVVETPFGERLLTYADHTATGRSLQLIENYIIQNVLPIYGNVHTSDNYLGQQITKMVNEATKYIKKSLGGGQDDALIFCGSGATAAIKRLQEVMGISIPSILRERMLGQLKSEERWVVFVGLSEHHSNILSWRQSLAEVVEIGLDKDGLLDIEALTLQLKHYSSTKRPMLGAFSACSNVVGTYTDTRALASLLHQYGAYACFDFAASGPYVEIDMRSGEMDGYDALFLALHKFAGGPGTPGILMMNKALYQLKSSPPSTCGGGTVKFVNCFSEKDTIYIEDIEEREDAGTPAIIQKVRAAAAFWIKEYIGYKAIEIQENKYIKRALERLLANPNVRILGNTNKSRQAVISFLVQSTDHSSNGICMVDKDREFVCHREETDKEHNKPLHGRFIAKLLNDLFGIQARGGCSCASPYGHKLLNIDEPTSSAIRSSIQKGNGGARPGWTRVSFPYYMSNEEFEFILDALEFTSIYGQRFLHLYDFNWKTGAWTLKKEANFQVKPYSGLNGTEEHMLSITKGGGIISKYASYLDTAKQIAFLLPESPSQRPIPDEIDVNFLTFMV